MFDTCVTPLLIGFLLFCYIVPCHIIPFLSEHFAVKIERIKGDLVRFEFQVRVTSFFLKQLFWDIWESIFGKK